MKIQTVLGPIDDSELGFTLMHEHIINIEWNFARAFSDFYDRKSVVDMFAEEAEALKAYGVKTFVDATPINLGRDTILMRECAERTGLQIIGCTGLYWQEWPYFHWGVEAEVLAEYLIREIEHGMEGTDSRPGFIKCASQVNPGATQINRNMLRAAAMASKATGLPIYTHTSPGSRLGEYQKQVFEEEGIAPEKIAFGHVLPGGDDAYVDCLTENGSFVGCDQLAFIRTDAEPLEKITKRLAGILKTEKRKRLFLSCDAAIRSDFGRTLTRILRDRSANSLVRKDRRKEVLFEKLLPALRAEGVMEEELNEVFTENPKRYFTGKK